MVKKRIWNKGLPSEMQPNFGRKFDGSKQSEFKKKWWASRKGLEMKEKLRKKFKEKNPIWSNPIAMESRRQKLIGKKHSKEHKKKIGEKSRQLWNSKNKYERELWIKNIVKGTIKKPSCLEKQMIKIIQQYNFPYKYTGDGSFIIGSKNPDFVNINGQKICLEVANRYHHSKDYKKNRINHFKKWGWQCIVFFECELNKLDENNIIEVLNDVNRTTNQCTEERKARRRGNRKRIFTGKDSENS